MKINKMIYIFALIVLSIIFCASGCNKEKYKEISFDEGIISETDYSNYDKLYKPVLEIWKTAVSECFGANLKTEENKSYPYLPEKIKISEWGIVDIYYSYYDIDRNGRAELIVAGYGEEYENKGSGNGCYYLFDVYALNGSEPVRLMKNVTDIGFERFDNNTINLSADGTVLIWWYSEKEPPYKNYELNYRIAADSVTAERIDGPAERYTGTELQNMYRKIQWNFLAKQAFSNIDYSEFIDTTYRKYPDVPAEYWDILNAYRQSVELTDCMGKYTSGDVFYELLCGKETVNFGITIDEFYAEEKGDIYIESMQNEKEVFGYGIHDINKDGIPELLLMTNKSDGIKSVWDIYSIDEGRAKCLIGFRQRKRCYGINEDGTIYAEHGNASYFAYEVYHIADGGHISFEEIYAEPCRVDGSDSVGFEYTYYFNEYWDPNEENIYEKKVLSQYDGGVFAERMSCEVGEDVAPFIEFVPLF